MPDYRNSTVHAIEICLAFRRHPIDKDYFLHGVKNILSSSVQLLADLPNNYNPPPPPKNPRNPFSFPTVHLFAVAVYMEKTKQLTFLDTVAMGLTTDMQTYKSLNPFQHLFHKTL